MFKRSLKQCLWVCGLLTLTMAVACGKDKEDNGDGDGDSGGDGDGDTGGSGEGDTGGTTGDGGSAAGGVTGVGGLTGGGEGGMGGDGTTEPLKCDLPEILDGDACRKVSVLVLSDIDDEDQSDNSVSPYLDNVGFAVTNGPFYAAWDGSTPSLDGIDVVLLLGGLDYTGILTPEARTAVQNFVAAGGGMIFTEWTAYQEDPNLDAGLLPVEYDGGYGYGADWVFTDTEHPLTRDLPSTAKGDTANYFSAAGWSYALPAPGAIVVIQGDEDPDSETPDGTDFPVATFSTCDGGTTIHLNHDVHYTQSPVAEGDLLLFRNAVYFAAMDNSDYPCTIL